MGFIVTYDESFSGVEYIFQGPTSGSDIKQATSIGIALCKERHSNRYLINGVDMEVTASVVELFELPTRQYVEEGLDRQSYIALVLPKNPKSVEDARFYESACFNRGWIVQLFEDRDTAIKWLMRQKLPSELDSSA